jgi:FKBP-type peptidyl-prolyl cis-trans isomerase
MTRLRAFSILPALGLVACGDSTDPLTNDDFAPELGVDLDAMTQTASGLYYQDLEVGEGAEAVTGSAATVHYEGFLANGNKFDSSRDRDEPFTFAVGIGGVIPGFDEGVSGMRVGGVRKLVIPPELAYGESGAGTVIPPNATLVFDIELLEVAQ